MVYHQKRLKIVTVDPIITYHAVAFKSDNVFIYDNSKKFVNVYTRKHNQVEINNLKQYPWINQGVTFSKKVQTQLEKFAENNPIITENLDKITKKDNPKI